jgi:hypothetical protein
VFEDIWTQTKLALYLAWTWFRNEITDNPLVGLGIIGIILVCWWLLKPKVKY